MVDQPGDRVSFGHSKVCQLYAQRDRRFGGALPKSLAPSGP
jgi:hypothetical protein